ncbi:MAG: hydantoinase B/oxoprolinase family protein [Candidatus Binataceae bacterium]
MHDPVLIEIIKNAMATIAEEIGIVAVRSAYSTAVKESADASAAVCDCAGQVIAQSLGAPLMHLSSLRWSPRELMKDFPPEQMKDGDVYLFNDQFRGGIHSNDIMVFKPVFSGGKPRFLTSALIHVADLGGLSAGGLPATATEYFHEGLMLPPVKLYDGGRLNEDLVRIISCNSRTPEKVMGDIRSMVGGTNVGARRLLELIDKYGLDQLEDLVRELLDYTERLTRSEIAKIPAGTYEGSYVIEDDGIVPDKTYTVRVAVTVKGSECDFDFTGTDPQARGAINAAFSQSISGVMFALRCFLEPSIPMNEGCFRPLTFTLPLGTMVNPRPPAACNARMATVQAVIDAVFQALSQAFEDKAVAASGNVHVYTMNGIDRSSGRIWSFMDPVIGSWGARSVKDGLDGQPISLFGGGDNRPSMEAFEIEYPVMFKRFQLWTDSGGPGKWRGGLGLQREVTVLEDAEITVRAADRCRLAPPGIMGGKPGKGGGWVINLGTAKQLDLPSKKTNQPLHAGDTLSMFISGGGGFGDARQRDPELVARDVAQGMVSIEAAARDYAVIVDAASFKVDAAATAKLRADRAIRRPP